ncbi:dihydroxyacetone kinase subunit DhaL [Mameliella sp. AT18]|uniref:dihydroxyacetone kinase subunit DhaL n=1 Tax=Mameliella sp. AT18 TaxID=3028385 RepID=UPI0008411363|nr:dihydroxyacetone kinase subunit DhaL [Mameliella sp. AT18]MDD9731649.1 dihydroxyacetone kinase subunit DhaL [Mameliella sp. AT18]ODM46413.1 dihydroxyacetone kinase subunit L [Ruegeria sp. PBVC088]
MSQKHRKLINDPDTLIEDLVAGMVSAHPDLICVEGDTGRAIVALNGPRDGKVGIVIGGGSGHEPAFAGYVGKGLADAAPLGNIFASPSPAQIMDAGFAADGGAGVLFLYGNYTGDVMNFGMAEEGLAEQGITARSFLVTDDIASAPPERASERRGIAGDFFVFKVAGAAADLGLSLDEVEQAAARANAATRTMGVALSACILPQTGRPNFDLPVGEMEIGMGIHGEPGIERGPAEGADAVVDRLLPPILEELACTAGDRVAVLVNGLGSTSLLELYLLHRRVAQLLEDRRITIHHSWVGEYCTSLDMEGASITLMKLDADLQAWLDHPCETPALRVGKPDVTRTARPRRHRDRVAPVAHSGDRTDLRTDGEVTPAEFRTMMQAGAEAIFGAVDRLCALDGEIGDGDHGVTMEIGWKAVMTAMDAADRDMTITDLCRVIADSFLSAVGASAGPLYASGFGAAGRAVSDRWALDTRALAAWLDGMAQGIAGRGGARPGDKTMLDAWMPAAEAAGVAASEGATLQDALIRARDAARHGANATAQMQSGKGRSQKLGQRSIGHVDPGAASAALLLAAWSDAL